MPQPSTSKWVVPRPVMPSTTSSVSGETSLISLAICFHVVAHGGGGFGGLHEDGADLGLEGLPYVREVEGLAVGRGDQLDLAAEGLGQVAPALAEFAGGQDQDAVAGRGEVRDGGFHGAGAGAGEQEHVVLRADEDLQLGEHFLEEGAEFRGAVVHVGGSHGELGGREQGGWAGSKKARFADHGFSFGLSDREIT